MEFGNPAALVNLCWLVPLMVGFAGLAWAWRRRALEVFGELGLLGRLTLGSSKASFVVSSLLTLGAAILLIVACSRPQFGTIIKTTERKGVNVLIAVDVSLSMMAKDIAPSRLDKAKSELRSLIDMLEGDKVGLITFAGTSFLQCPLTLDYEAVQMFLDAIGPDEIPVRGTHISEAVDRAVQAFKGSGRPHRTLVLLSDGEDHSGQLKESVQRAKDEGIKILTIGIGDPKGEPIPIQDENGVPMGQLKDSSGQIVMSKLDEQALQKMALETGGLYFRATAGEIEVAKIAEAIAKMEKEDLSSREASHKEERFQIPLLLAVLCLVGEMAFAQRGGGKRP